MLRASALISLFVALIESGCSDSQPAAQTSPMVDGLADRKDEDRIASIFGNADLGSGLDSAMGGLVGTEDAIGNEGLGRAEPRPKTKGRVELTSVVVSG